MIRDTEHNLLKDRDYDTELKQVQMCRHRDKISLTFLLKTCLMKGVTGSWIKLESVSKQGYAKRGLKHRRYSNDKEFRIKF